MKDKLKKEYDNQLQQKENIIILCKNKHQKEVPETTFCDEGVKLIFQFIKEDISKILDKEKK